VPSTSSISSSTSSTQTLSPAPSSSTTPEPTFAKSSSSSSSSNPADYVVDPFSHTQINSNNLNLPAPDTNKRWLFAPRSGHAALYSGIRSLRENEDENLLHIGWTGPILDTNNSNTSNNNMKVNGGSGLNEDMKQALMEELKPHHCVPVLMEDKVAIGSYDGYCKTGE
jgi:trehalose 6-phosphate synthase/phosphatase